MALYLVPLPSGKTALTRARNGVAACALCGVDSDAVHAAAGPARVTEDGPAGIIGPDGGILESGALDAAAPAQPAEDAGEESDGGTADEIDVTELSDRKVRRYRNVETGKERTVPRGTSD